MNHRIGRWVFALAIGLSVAVFAYQWITDPTPRAERALEESIVLASRDQVIATLAVGDLEIVDALAPNRKVGKAYIYRNGDGWEVSGFYRRSEDDSWHPYLLSLNAAIELEHLKFQDSDEDLVDRAEQDPRLELKK